MQYVLIGLVALAGSFVQSATGFGYAVTCMALWPLFLPLRQAAVMEVITAFAMVAYLAVRLRRHIRWRLMLWPLGASLITSTAGVALLTSTPDAALRRALGVALVALSVYFLFFSSRIRIRATPLAGVTAGLISGLFSGLFSMGGPPMVVYFLAATDDKETYSATLQCYFCFTTVYTFLNHLVLGNVTPQVAAGSAAALCGLAVGTLLGLRLFRRLSLQALKRLVYLFMACAGLYMAAGG